MVSIRRLGRDPHGVLARLPINADDRKHPAATACFTGDLDALPAIHRVPMRHRMRALGYVPRSGSQPLRAVIGRTRPALSRRIAVVQRTAALSPTAAAFLDVPAAPRNHTAP